MSVDTMYRVWFGMERFQTAMVGCLYYVKD